LKDKLEYGANFEEIKRNCRMLGTGAESVVVFTNNKAIKLGSNLINEFNCLNRLIDSKNVIQLKSEKIITLPYDTLKMGLKLEYIQGKSLDYIIKEEGYLDYNRSLKYAYHIHNGLIELRSANIFHHRDIRPANIMIEDTTETAKIIDLGIATMNKRNRPKKNRRYGGLNDLISLGQIIYKMATGLNLFDKSNTMEKTIYAWKINDQRNKIYFDSTRTLLKKYLNKVDENITDSNTAKIIKMCLTATEKSHNLIREKLFPYR
jgi:serine/threonine protein kinase